MSRRSMTVFGRRLLFGRLFIAASIAAGSLPIAAHAALGGEEATAVEDARTLGGSVKSMDFNNYRVHSIELPSGTVLREYALLNGTVFGVAWSGPSLPDLKQALGNYFDNYVTGARAARTGHHHVRVQEDGFVMQSSGHMRAFTGRAYLPKALPAGFSLAELH